MSVCKVASLPDLGRSEVRVWMGCGWSGVGGEGRSGYRWLSGDAGRGYEWVELR